MSRTTINALYIGFTVLMTVLIPILLFVGTNGSMEGTLAAVLSFAIMASYIIYTLLLGSRN